MSKLITLSAIVVAALAGAVHTAKATFPAQNGRIAYTDLTTAGIFTMKADGTDPRQVTTPSDAASFDTEPAWSPNGQLLVFTEYHNDGSPARLWLVNADGTNRHLLFTPDPNYADGQANWAPDGSRVIFRRCSLTRYEACAIYTVKVGGNGMNAITKFQANNAADDFDVKPEYSPQGNTISFSSFNRGGVQNGVYLMGAHGTGINLITPTALGAVDADWAPDGTKIAFWTHCCDPTDAATIDTMNPDGSGITQLTFPGSSHDLRPSYSPQGDQIAFERDAPDFSTSDIWTVPAGGGSPAMLRANASNPAWGPAPS